MASVLQAHQDTIKRLYVDEGKTLVCIMEYMQTTHGINVGKTAYERFFRNSGIRKRKKGENWNWVDRRIAKRERAGQRSELRVNGEKLPMNKVRREIARHVSTHQQCTRFTDQAPSPTTPEGYQIQTPATSLSTLTPKDSSYLDPFMALSSPSSLHESLEIPTTPTEAPRSGNQSHEASHLARVEEQDGRWVFQLVQNTRGFERYETSHLYDWTRPFY